jgi:hypothetical protein
LFKVRVVYAAVRMSMAEKKKKVMEKQRGSEEIVHAPSRYFYMPTTGV